MTTPTTSPTLRPAARTAAIAFGGAVGAVGRGVLGETFPANGSWPWGTLVANLAGTALLAWLVFRHATLMRPGSVAQLVLGTGLCGALTTFSLLQVEVIDLAREGRLGIAIAYITTSVAAGLVLAFGARRSETS